MTRYAVPLVSNVRNGWHNCGCIAFAIADRHRLWSRMIARIERITSWVELRVSPTHRQFPRICSVPSRESDAEVSPCFSTIKYIYSLLKFRVRATLGIRAPTVYISINGLWNLRESLCVNMNRIAARAVWLQSENRLSQNLPAYKARRAR